MYPHIIYTIQQTINLSKISGHYTMNQKQCSKILLIFYFLSEPHYTDIKNLLTILSEESYPPLCGSVVDCQIT